MSDSSDPIGEVIKAGRDIAVEASKRSRKQPRPLLKVLDLARDAGRYFGVAAEEFATLLSDRMRYYRFLNFLIRSLRKVSDLHRQGDIHQKPSNNFLSGVAIQVLEKASLRKKTMCKIYGQRSSPML